MGKIVGIDLGTTNSLVAYLDPQTKQPQCIVGPHGSTLCPSVVSLDPDGNIIVGEPARRRLLTQPERTIYSVKRLMGRGVKDIQDELKLFPFRLDPSSSNVIRVRLGEKVFTPPEISAFILRELKNWAEAYFGETVDRAVITVPAYFNDTHLGGDDIDNLLQSFVHELVLQHDEIDFSPHGELAQELRRALIIVKHQLSESETATLRFSLPNGTVFIHEFTRGALEALIRPVVDRTMGPVRQALADAQLNPADIEEVVLVGGATRTPLIRRTVQEFFGRKPHTELNPDEVVALGAAVQANILDRGVKTMLLLDVTPLSLGIETYGGAVAKIIPRNSTIPASAQELYTTGVDNQTGIDIHVLQGERELARDCRSLARFTLKVPPAPAGLPR